MPMNFAADFHIHARFSRATSKTLDFEQLPIAVQLKGISVNLLEPRE
jgi:PHP family Zn ribbon phosphoesterase